MSEGRNYIILESRTADAMAKVVRMHADLGYEPCGGLSVVMTSAVPQGKGAHVVFYQAMWKKGE
jgi:hypothetical protein